MNVIEFVWQGIITYNSKGVQCRYMRPYLDNPESGFACGAELPLTSLSFSEDTVHVVLKDGTKRTYVNPAIVQPTCFGTKETEPGALPAPLAGKKPTEVRSTPSKENGIIN